MPVAFCWLLLKWYLCVDTPLLALQPPVTLWQIYNGVIKVRFFVNRMAWSSLIIHQFDTINLSSRVKHLMVQVY